MASNKKGITGENLLQILETRLDNIVYRMGLGTSRAEARQIVRHGHIAVNGKKVNIPSYLVSKEDVIAIRESSLNNDKFKAIMEQTAGRTVPAWLDFNADKKQATVVDLPKREDIDLPVQEHLIVELYSK
jgi:small subunit ribosomal protein S4